MRAVVCHAFGSPHELTLEEVASPIPKPDEVRVALQAWGLNYVDVLMIAGGYQLRPDLPFTPGLEAAGVIDKVGEDVEGYAVGDRVIVGLRPGTLAEQVVVPAHTCLPIPGAMATDQAACFRSAFQTAYHGLVQGGRLQSGEIALIHGAAGGMGLAAVQVAKLLGATVIATANSLERLQVAKALGADHILSYGQGSFRGDVRRLTGGVDVVFDPVGGDVFDESMRCLNWGARLVVVGFTAGRAAHAKTNHVLIKGASVVGIRAGEFARRNPVLGKENQTVLLDWARQGLVESHISHRFPFESFALALQAIADREVIGRVVLHR
ncbi:MAG: NADPH:quinone oxidoreductase family protein [Rhodospirillaceae bacterium]|jgi:NADPH:quinone reductase|nr:NADPH:quinone oxidoreductase family protein [Rhodospirillaceae bacterium]